MSSRLMTGTTSNALDFSGSTGANLSGAFLGRYASNGAKAEAQRRHHRR